MSEIIKECEKKLETFFRNVEEISLFNQEKVLNAMSNNKVALRHFSATSGYGYDDTGRDTLCKIFAEVFDAEAAVVSPMIANGTHALTLALFAVLRPGDSFYSITGKPYDTLNDVISGDNIGSLKDFKINFSYQSLIDNKVDFVKLKKKLKEDSSIKLIYIQRSRGYEWRLPLSITDIKNICNEVKKINPKLIIMVDNCYGEFVEKYEPTSVGADIIAGSLIKNPGGGIAPTGGYIAGKKDYIDLVGGRLTAPSEGIEVGSYDNGYRAFYQGLFMAPHTVCQAIKGAALYAEAFKYFGFEVLPADNRFYDIITSIKLENENNLIKFCQMVQAASPVDSFAAPYPWDMPGYQNKVIMAAGCFVQGASIELSCDGPVIPPYTVYLQGGLTYEHVKISVIKCLKGLNLI